VRSLASTGSRAITMMAATPTRAWTTRESAVKSPKMTATRSNLNAARSPQFNAPTSTSANAIKSISRAMMELLFGYDLYLKKFVAALAARCGG